VPPTTLYITLHNGGSSCLEVIVLGVGISAREVYVERLEVDCQEGRCDIIKRLNYAYMGPYPR